jgi:glucan phosphoethanolaminetransferase (alkaline phosphatase superfamily)
MLEWLEYTPLALWVKESWGWPFALTLHSFGSAVMVSFGIIMALRLLLGVFKTIPASSFIKLIPFIWVSLAGQAVSGILLWMTKPARYLSDGLFEVKLAFIVTGIVMTVYFQRTLKAEAAGWDAQSGGLASVRGGQYIAAVALAWSAVLVTGRLTAYLGQLYHA